MKKVLIVVILGVAALVAYNFATTGKLSLIPSAALSTEDRELRDLEQRLESAKHQFAQAERAAGIGGLDTTGDVEAARAAVKRIQSDLAALTKRLTSPSSIREAESLSSAAAEFADRVR